MKLLQEYGKTQDKAIQVGVVGKCVEKQEFPSIKLWDPVLQTGLLMSFLVVVLCSKVLSVGVLQLAVTHGALPRVAAQGRQDKCSPGTAFLMPDKNPTECSATNPASVRNEDTFFVLLLQ